MDGSTAPAPWEIAMKVTTASVAIVGASLALFSAAPAVSTAATTTTGIATNATSLLAATTTTSPVAYADSLVRAWGRGDAMRVDQLSTATVARALRAYSWPGGVNWRRTSWQGTAGTIYVNYHDDARGGTVTIGVSDVLLSEGRQHDAYTVRFSQTHPIGPVTYADRLVRAWGRGDHAAVAAYATPTAARILFAHADPGGAHWRRVAAQGAAGTTYVTYHDDAHGGHLVLAVGNFAEQDGQFHAVYDARFSR
jgi:hypothetical protein